MWHTWCGLLKTRNNDVAYLRTHKTCYGIVQTMMWHTSCDKNNDMAYTSQNMLWHTQSNDMAQVQQT